MWWGGDEQVKGGTARCERYVSSGKEQIGNMSITGFRHVGLTVSDLGRSAAWYAEVLGFKELFRAFQPRP